MFVVVYLFLGAVPGFRGALCGGGSRRAQMRLSRQRVRPRCCGPSRRVPPRCREGTGTSFFARESLFVLSFRSGFHPAFARSLFSEAALDKDELAREHCQDVGCCHDGSLDSSTFFFLFFQWFRGASRVMTWGFVGQLLRVLSFGSWIVVRILWLWY